MHYESCTFTLLKHTKVTMFLQCRIAATKTIHPSPSFIPIVSFTRPDQRRRQCNSGKKNDMLCYILVIAKLSNKLSFVTYTYINKQVSKKSNSLTAAASSFFTTLIPLKVLYSLREAHTEEQCNSTTSTEAISMTAQIYYDLWSWLFFLKGYILYTSYTQKALSPSWPFSHGQVKRENKLLLLAHAFCTHFFIPSRESKGSGA